MNFLLKSGHFLSFRFHNFNIYHCFSFFEFIFILYFIKANLKDTDSINPLLFKKVVLKGESRVEYTPLHILSY